ncbi:hypothetical protein PENFLA_c005G01952 [Penicillium flavigenum]|uniref:Uncharacterized protein n=1 Tax=Penicillium flavigenum TaxID=254877 RepID=A0A1V6TNR1_9EURO|nr:hypothetical protein PENFLA_c005G01952 [Penicillium flavigenum]
MPSTADSQASQPPTPTEASTASSSQAWIAGVVVGPLAGIAVIIALIVWWIYRRKQKQPPLSQEQLFMSHGPLQPSHPPPGYPLQQPMEYPPQQPMGYPLETYKQMHELPTVQTPRVYELGSNGYR